MLDKLHRQWDKGYFLCVGLDTGDLDVNRRIVDDTYGMVCAYKLNLAFYLHDMEALISTRQHIPLDVPVILDAKWGDVKHTNEAYACVLDSLDVDAVTVSPYVGLSDLQPLMDKMAFVLCHTSNPGAPEFQTLMTDEGPLYEVIATKVAEHPNCGLVIGATYPDRLRKVRAIVGDIPILVPGIGVQGGTIEGALRGLDSKGQGVILSASRSIIHDPRSAVQQINRMVQDALR